MEEAPTPVYWIVQLSGLRLDVLELGMLVTRISRYMERARPITSKPGPGRGD